MVELYNFFEFCKIHRVQLAILKVVGTQLGNRLDGLERIRKDIIELISHGIGDILDVVLVSSDNRIFIFLLESRKSLYDKINDKNQRGESYDGIL